MVLYQGCVIMEIVCKGGETDGLEKKAWKLVISIMSVVHKLECKLE